MPTIGTNGRCTLAYRDIVVKGVDFDIWIRMRRLLAARVHGVTRDAVKLIQRIVMRIMKDSRSWSKLIFSLPIVGSQLINEKRLARLLLEEGRRHGCNGRYEEQNKISYDGRIFQVFPLPAK